MSSKELNKGKAIYCLSSLRMVFIITGNKYKSIRKAPFKTPHKKILRGFVVYF